jgi:hypothetical protein
MRGAGILGFLLLLVLSVSACGQGPDRFVGTWRLPDAEAPQLAIAATDQGYLLSLLAVPGAEPLPLVADGDSLLISPDFEAPAGVTGFNIRIDPGASDDELLYSDGGVSDLRLVRVSGATMLPSD